LNKQVDDSACDKIKKVRPVRKEASRMCVTAANLGFEDACMPTCMGSPDDAVANGKEACKHAAVLGREQVLWCDIGYKEAFKATKKSVHEKLLSLGHDNKKVNEVEHADEARKLEESKNQLRSAAAAAETAASNERAAAAAADAENRRNLEQASKEEKAQEQRRQQEAQQKAEEKMRQQQEEPKASDTHQL
jgi:flagellar biosynthesis GTPase FlhF